MSATSATENGLNVPQAAKEVTLTPPFALECQLVATPDAECNTPDRVFRERNRMWEAVYPKKLESIHKQLWYAGRKSNISPLHHQKVIRRDIVLTERASLHLVWFERIIYVKRLNDELLDWTYFSQVLCGDKTLHQAASGFLLSYTRLIEYPSDLDIAKTSALINRDVTWKKWQTFRTSVIHHLGDLADRDIHDR